MEENITFKPSVRNHNATNRTRTATDVIIIVTTVIVVIVVTTKTAISIRFR
jgi:hypothetical protein